MIENPEIDTIDESCFLDGKNPHATRCFGRISRGSKNESTINKLIREKIAVYGMDR